MSDKATNYQCPSCTGPLHYDGAAGRLQCDYCGSSFDPAEIEKLYAEKEQQAASQPETGSDTGEWQSSADEDWGTDADQDARIQLSVLRCAADLRGGPRRRPRARTAATRPSFPSSSAAFSSRTTYCRSS